MASSRSTAVALLGRNDGARAQLRQSLEELGASVVFEGDAAGTMAGQLLERAPRVVIVNLAENSDDDFDHLQSVFDAPEVNVVFNDADVSSRLQGWDLARWARHLAAKVLGDDNIMPPPPPGAEALPLHDLMPSPGAPPTPAQLAPQRPIEEFVMEAEDRVDALPDDFLPLASLDHAPPMQRDTSIDVDFGAVDVAMIETPADAPARVAPEIVRVELEVNDEELPDTIPLPDLGELDRALEAQAQMVVGSGRSERELLDEALGGLDLDFVIPVDDPDPVSEPFVVEGADRTAPAVDPGLDASDLAIDDTDGITLDDTEATAFTRAPTNDATRAPVAVPFGALFLEDDAPAAAAPVDERTPSDAPRPLDAAQFQDTDWALTDDDTEDTAPSVDASSDTSPNVIAPDVPDDWALEDDAADADAAPIEGRAVFALPEPEPQIVVEDIDDVDFADIASDFGFTLETDTLPAATAADTAADANRAAPSWTSDDTDLQFDESNLDDDVAALAAQLDAMEDSAPRFDAVDGESFSIASMDDGDDATPPAAAPATTQAAAVPANIDFGSLELTSLDAEIEAAPRVAQAANFDFSGIGSLSLEPIEDEDASEAGAAVDVGADPLLLAMGLVDAPPKERAVPGEIARVIVLGASIGGPDALRTFLGGIPAGFPALFVLVQHLENGYFERLSQQLQKATKLNVRALAAGAADAQSGDVLVVPADARYTVERNGVIASTAHAAPPHYTPCIDDVIRDAADRFGARTTVIIFSGMAGDAIEGAVYATAKGAQVWVQDPASCVVSSMVDGAKSRGVVEFIGSPRELADHCVALYGN